MCQRFHTPLHHFNWVTFSSFVAFCFLRIRFDFEATPGILLRCCLCTKFRSCGTDATCLICKIVTIMSICNAKFPRALSQASMTIFEHQLFLYTTRMPRVFSNTNSPSALCEVFNATANEIPSNSFRLNATKGKNLTDANSCQANTNDLLVLK